MRFDPTQPFTRSQALAAGLNDRQLHGPGFRKLLGGIYISERAPVTALTMARAALLPHPGDAVASHFTVGRVLGAPVPTNALEHVTVARQADRRQRHGVRCHVAALEAADIQVLHGVRLTAPHRFFGDLAGFLGLVDLVVVGDWLVRKGYVTPASLIEYCRRTRTRHAADARRAAAYVRARVDSPMETRLRMLLVLAGLPEPTVNLQLRDEFGTVVKRLDLSYPRVRLAVEYDGRHHVEVVEQWEHDHGRRAELEDDEWRLLVVTSKGIYRHPEQTIDRVWRALKARGWRPLPRPNDAWRQHFPH